MQETQVLARIINLVASRNSSGLSKIELASFVAVYILTAAIPDSLPAETTITQRGTPAYEPTGVVVTSFPLRNSGQPAWGNQIVANTVDMLGDAYQTASDECWLCPNAVLDGPYDRELREAVAAQGRISTDVFLAEEASYGSSLFKGLVFVPAEDHQRIPKDVFPMRFTGQLFKDGRPQGDSLSYQLDRSYQVELTHLPDLSYIGPSADDIPVEAPGVYEWRTTYRDANGNGWNIVDSFTVVAVPTEIGGDLNYNGALDQHDLDILTKNVAVGATNLKLDIDDNESVSVSDVYHWVTELKSTWLGDANLDGEFNSRDLVDVFKSGKYESGHMASWAEGDWNADERFDSSDIIVAFQDSGYEVGARTLALAVPEPTSWSMVILGLLGIVWGRNH